MTWLRNLAAITVDNLARRRKMKNFRMQFLIVLALVLGIIHVSLAGRPAGTKNGSGLKKTLTNGVRSPMDINNIFNYYSNNGDGSFNPFTTSDEGFEFPIGSNDGTCIFEDGLVWTAFKNDTLHCGGSTYNHGLQAGRIITAALPAVCQCRIIRPIPKTGHTVFDRISGPRLILIQ